MAADAPAKKEEAPKDGDKGKKADKDAPKKEVELSEEDLALKEALELMVTRVSDPEPGVVKLALEGLRKEIRTATRRAGRPTAGRFLAWPREHWPSLTRASLRCSSMTSVPKPLKFLRPHYAGLTEAYEKCTHQENKKLLADILSLLAMTRQHVPGEVPESLKYRLLGSSEEIGTWGHEVRAKATTLSSPVHGARCLPPRAAATMSSPSVQSRQQGSLLPRECEPLNVGFVSAIRWARDAGT